MRTDEHSPKNFDPADYAYAYMIDLNPSKGIESGMPVEYAEAARAAVRGFLEGPRPDHPHRAIGQCEHCGAHFVYGAIFLHIPTQTYIQVGNVCADDAFGCDSRRAYDLKRAKEMASAARAGLARKAKAGAFLASHEGLADLFAVFAPRHDVLEDLRQSLGRWGSLSEKQLALAHKIRSRLVSELLSTGPSCEKCGGGHDLDECPNREHAPTGRASAKVRIVHTRWTENNYGGALKGLYVAEGGWKAWGTVPAKWIDATSKMGDVDSRMYSFVVRATFEPKTGDPHFAFLKRPTI